VSGINREREMLLVVTQPVNPILAAGIPVYIQGWGQNARVTPR